MKRVIILLSVLLNCVVTIEAAEKFVSFTECPNAVCITQAPIVYGENEYEGVKIAIANLQADMLRVIGHKPSANVGESKEGAILIGTIGKNKEIDALGIQGLKGCREKYIIRLVI